MEDKCDNSVYEFDDEAIGRWYLDCTEGSISLKTGSAYDSCLIVKMQKGPDIGSLMADLATSSGRTTTKRLSLAKFEASGSVFSGRFKKMAFSRSVFLTEFNVFANFRRATPWKLGGTVADDTQSLSASWSSDSASKTTSGKLGETVTDGTQSLSASCSSDSASKATSGKLGETVTDGTQSLSDSCSSDSASKATSSRSGETLANCSQKSPASDKSKPAEVQSDCSPTALDRHKVADSFRVKLSLLRPPPENIQVRPLDPKHVLTVQKAIKANPDCQYLKFLVNIDNVSPGEVDIEKVNSGEYTLHVIGGNHTREALQTATGVGEVEAVVYAGLNQRQSFCLGIRHNEGYKKAKKMDFATYISIFRRQWLSTVSDPNSAGGRLERVQFKDALSGLLRISKKQLDVRFRHHMYLATLSQPIWQKAYLFMDKWEKREILEQPDRTFSAYVVSLLEKTPSKAGLEEALTKLCSGQMSWADLKQQLDKKQMTKARDNQTGVQVTDLQEENATLKRRNKELEDTVTQLKAKIARVKTMDDKTEAVHKKKEASEVSGEDESEDREERLDEARKEGVSDARKEGVGEAKKEEVDEATKEGVDEARKERADGARKEEVYEARKEKTVDELRREEFEAGDWLSVMYQGTYWIGKNVGHLQNNILKVQFLTGRCRGKLSKKDIQLVDYKFVVTKLSISCEKGLYFLSEAETERASEYFEIFKKKYM